MPSSGKCGAPYGTPSPLLSLSIQALTLADAVALTRTVPWAPFGRDVQIILDWAGIDFYTVFNYELDDFQSYDGTPKNEVDIYTRDLFIADWNGMDKITIRRFDEDRDLEWLHYALDCLTEPPRNLCIEMSNWEKEEKKTDFYDFDGYRLVAADLDPDKSCKTTYRRIKIIFSCVQNFK